MCNHVYTVPDHRKPRPNGNRCPYPDIYLSFLPTPLDLAIELQSPELPIDDQGKCIFHSEQADWKRSNDFTGKFHELLQLLDRTPANYDFAEFVFVGSEIKTESGAASHVLCVIDTIFRKEAIFTGAFFLDSVEFDGVVFEQGATFPKSNFLKNLRMANTRCRSLDFERAKVAGTAFFVEVNCISQALFNRTRFTCTTDGYVVKFDGVRFQGITTFADSAFMLGDESAIGFLNVTFEDIADFSNAHLKGDVTFDSVSFESTTEFIDTLFDSVGSAARYRGAAVKLHRLDVKTGARLTFMSTDPSRKMFNHDVSITFNGDPAGIVRFENVQFNRILKTSKDHLTRLATFGHVEIGPGCIKYRYQTGVRTIFMGQDNAHLVLELCQTFTNYFTTHNGLSLGFEVVERDKSKISFFYFTDEDISETEFLERLEHTERDLWNLLSTTSYDSLPASGAQAEISSGGKESAVINAVDAISALLGTFFRVGVRIAVGAWEADDTRALLGAVRFNDQGAEQRALSLHQAFVEKYTGQTLFGISRGQNQLLVPMSATSDGPPEPEIVTILFLGANSSHAPMDLEVEVKKIKDNLKLGRQRENLVFEQEGAVTIDSLTQAMLDQAPTIVHFAGHGKQMGIILRDEMGKPQVVSADALSDLFRLFKDTVRCVVLNACYSESQARAIRQHIPYVIGMRAEILDSAAAAFSAGFYKAIAAGRNVPFAFDMGQARIKLEGLEGADIPVLM